jgi:hypothetical protein
MLPEMRVECTIITIREATILHPIPHSLRYIFTFASEVINFLLFLLSSPFTAFLEAIAVEQGRH